METDITIQLLEKKITSNSSVEIRDALDKDYKYLVGLAIVDGVCSGTSLIEIAKVKGVEFLPENFEAVNIVASKHVEPNKRFFSLFNPVQIRGDDLIINFIDTEFDTDYTLKIQALLTNHPKEIKDVLNS